MGQGQSKGDSVFDFIYVDTRRISLLLSQLDSDGVLTEMTRQADETAELSGGFDLKVLKAGAKEGAKSSLSRRFDPQWLIPLKFLDAAQDLLVRDLEQARIGQLVLVSGGLSVLDLGLLKTLWELPIVRKMIEASMEVPQAVPALNRSERRKPGNQPGKSSQSDFGELVMAMLKLLPHAVQASLYEEDGGTVWSSLNLDSMVGSPSDLLLKHGQVIAGQWNAVGILDALPEVKNHDAMRARVEMEIRSSEFGKLLSAIAPTLKMGFARPDYAYGMTPLVLFREIEQG